MFLILAAVPAAARDISQWQGGMVLLDLDEDAPDEIYDGSQLKPRPDNTSLWQDLIKSGYNYIEDVKNYHDLLPDETINKDFSEDIQTKYPHYSAGGANEWQNFVRKGVKVYRFFTQAKQKIKDWVLNYELPVIVDDNQYATSSPEPYIETDKPLVVEDFKKVVSYSKSPKDRLAWEEKYAKDHNQTRPSQLIRWYRQHLMQGKWKELLKSVFFNPELKPQNSAPAAQDDSPHYFMFMEHKGLTSDGHFSGALKIVIPSGKIALLNSYKYHSGLHISFAGSANTGEITTYLMPPQSHRMSDGRLLLFYSDTFAVYFTGQAQDADRPVLLRPRINLSFCQDDDCFTQDKTLELNYRPLGTDSPSRYADFVRQVNNQTADKRDNSAFNVGDMIWDNSEAMPHLRLTFTAKGDPYNTQIYLLGDYAQHFAAPQISFADGRITARFRQIDTYFQPLGKTIPVWIFGERNTQYFHSHEIKAESSLDTSGSKFNLGILLLAIWGGFLLNLMPCVFPVLSLKILAFIKATDITQAQTRRRFGLNSLGIITAFVLLGIFLALLKKAGMVLGWGMQFQNITFLSLVIWSVVYFLAYLSGWEHWRSITPSIPQSWRFLQSENTFEFLSGIFMAILATPCMAPYLGTALGIALGEPPLIILMVVSATGFGAALPYLLIAVFPQTTAAFPPAGKWMNILSLFMRLLLIITLCWLVGILASQSGGEQIWHWLIYIILALLLFYFKAVFVREVDKQAAGELRDMLHKHYTHRFWAAIIIIAVFSIFDARSAKQQRDNLQTQTTIQELDLEEISRAVDNGEKVLVKISADWCLTCKYNDALVLNMEHIQDDLADSNVRVISIDWTHYDEQVLNFMRRFGRQGIPFYVLFSPKFKDGIVLPEILDSDDLMDITNM